MRKVGAAKFIHLEACHCLPAGVMSQKAGCRQVLSGVHQQGLCAAGWIDFPPRRGGVCPIFAMKLSDLKLQVVVF